MFKKEGSPTSVIPSPIAFYAEEPIDLPIDQPTNSSNSVAPITYWENLSPENQDRVTEHTRRPYQQQG